MSKIKNTRELVLRARGHARQDHIQQGTYGDASCNGHLEFKGCAIGCLATPHRQSELRAFIKRFGWKDDDTGDWFLNEDNDSAKQVKRLKREFGICEPLARLAEGIFEGARTHGAAINVIPEFAAALPEGVNITPRMVYAANIRITGTSSMTDRRNIYSHKDEFLDWLRGLA